MAPSEYFTLIRLKPIIILKSTRRLRQTQLESDLFIKGWGIWRTLLYFRWLPRNILL